MSVFGGGIEKLSQLEIDANKDWLDFILHNIKQLIIGEALGSQTPKIYIQTGVVATDQNHAFRLVDSGGVTRTALRNSGIQSWLMNNGVVNAGNIIYTTPAGKPGFVIDTSSTFEGGTNAFHYRNYGTSFTMGFSGVSFESLVFDNSKNVMIGTQTSPSGQRVLAFLNAVAPSAMPANMCGFYAIDVASSSEMHVMDEADNVTVLSPHAFEDGFIERSGSMDWLYRSKNRFIGKEVAVNLFEVIKDLEGITGKTYIKVKDVPQNEKLDWDTREEEKRSQKEEEVTERTNDKNQFITKIQELTSQLPQASKEEKKTIQAQITQCAKIRNEIIIPQSYTKKSRPTWLDLPKPASNISTGDILVQAEPSRIRRITNALRLTR